MTPRDLFGCIVRTTGFLLIVLNLLAIVTDASRPGPWSLSQASIAALAVEACCLFLADWFVDLAYGKGPSDAA